LNIVNEYPKPLEVCVMKLVKMWGVHSSIQYFYVEFNVEIPCDGEMHTLWLTMVEVNWFLWWMNTQINISASQSYACAENHCYGCEKLCDAEHPSPIEYLCLFVECP